MRNFQYLIFLFLLVGIIQNKAYYIELSIILNLILHYKLRKKKNLVDIKNVISYSYFFFSCDNV